MSPRGVFFDFFGTLLLYGDMQAAWSDWVSAFHANLVKHGLSVSKEAFRRRCDGFFALPEPPAGADDLSIFERRVARLCRQLGLTLGDAEIREAASAAVDAWQAHVMCDPEASRVLTALGRNKILALVSNFDHPPHLHRLLTELHLRGFFDAVVISGEVDVKKPDPAIFWTAFEQTGLRAEDVVYVGDHAEDVAAARAAGIEPILIRRPRPENAAVILDFSADPRRATDHHPGPEVTDGVKRISALPELLQILS